MMNCKNCILIQTNDSYEFLWEGLYLSWKLNWIWSEFDFPVFVITESKEFNLFKDERWRTIKCGNELTGAKNYSTKLILALEELQKLGYEKVLYSQDDTWPITSPDSSIVFGALRMFESENLDAFYIHEHRSHFPFTLQNTDKFICGRRVRKFYGMSRFYYNHGCAFWKIQSLLDLQRTDEDPYENEYLGTQRCWQSQPKAFFLNYPWYDQDNIQKNGIMKNSGIEILNNLKFRFSWETKENFMWNYISSDGSIIPISPDNKIWQSLTQEQIDELFSKSYGHHFSHYL